MIRLKNLEYFDDRGVGFFKFQNETAYSNLEQNPKTLYIKLAKYYKLKGYSKFKKDDLIQFIIDNNGYVHTDENENILVEQLGNINLNDDEDENILTKQLENINIVNVPNRINPIEELNEKLKNTNLTEREIDCLKGCYVYRIWLWKNNNRTFDEEMDRACKIIAEERKYN